MHVKNIRNIKFNSQIFKILTQKKIYEKFEEIPSKLIWRNFIITSTLCFSWFLMGSENGLAQLISQLARRDDLDLVALVLVLVFSLYTLFITFQASTLIIIMIYALLYTATLNLLPCYQKKKAILKLIETHHFSS